MVLCGGDCDSMFEDLAAHGLEECFGKRLELKTFSLLDECSGDWGTKDFPDFNGKFTLPRASICGDSVGDVIPIEG